MSLPPFTTRVKTNTDNVLQMTQMINGIMMTGDSRANQIIVELYNNEGRTPIIPGEDTKIVGYFIRGDGYTVEVDGTINENGEAVVIIPKAAYLVTGAISIAIRLLDDKEIVIVESREIITYNTKIVIAALSCFVQNTETDSIIDPDHHIPDVQELLAYIETLDTLKNQMIEDNATMNANEAIRQTNEQSRITETDAAVYQITAMTTDARRVAHDQNPSAEISVVDGHKHIRFNLPVGDPFKIKRTFTSVAEMEAYTGTDVTNGDFVLIVSNVEDPDNAKLYIRDNNTWRFIVDLSGSRGFIGETGNGIDSAVLNQDYTLTLNFTDGTSYTSTSIRGAIGPRGYGISDVTFNQDGSANLILENGTVVVTPPIKGEPGVGSFTVNYNSVEDAIDIQIINADEGS